MEQSTTHEINYAELSERHRNVLNDIARGMAKYKSYQKEYPNCSSMNSALQQVSRILTNPIAVLYLKEQREHQQRYVSENHTISKDKDCAIYATSINNLLQDVEEARAEKDWNSVAKLEAQITAKQVAHERMTGMGAFNPIYKQEQELLLTQQQNALEAQQRAKQIAEGNTDNGLLNGNNGLGNMNNGITSTSTNSFSFTDGIIEVKAEAVSDDKPCDKAVSNTEQ